MRSPSFRFPFVPAFVATVLLVVPLSAEAFFWWKPVPFAAPDELGPYAVGRVTYAIVDPDREDRPLQIDVLYPVDPEDAVGPPAVYSLIGFGRASDNAIEDAPISEDRRFPLVAFSHGSGGIRFQSFFLTELLASHGFVVVAPDHTGNTLIEGIFGGGDPLPVVAFNRPLDISFVISHMLERNADPDDALYQTIHPHRVGVTGHSFGGFTSIAMAAGFSGAGFPLPDGLDPIPPDPRVRAIVPIAPVSSAHTDEELAAIDVPTTIIGGTLDTTTPVDPESRRAFELIPRPVFRVDLIDAVHFSFTESCAFVETLIDQGLDPDLIEDLVGSDFLEPCGDDVMDIEEAQRITQVYAVAHMRRYLNHDLRYAGFFRPGYAAIFEPEVEFWAKPKPLHWLFWLLAWLFGWF